VKRYYYNKGSGKKGHQYFYNNEPCVLLSIGFEGGDAQPSEIIIQQGSEDIIVEANADGEFENLSYEI